MDTHTTDYSEPLLIAQQRLRDANDAAARHDWGNAFAHFLQASTAAKMAADACRVADARQHSRRQP